jgi:sugar-specific transcriptional regulator TrmB
LSVVSGHVAILVELGLALSEEIFFLVLSQGGPATAKTVAKASDVVMTAFYQIMPNLQEKGLVEVIVSSPKMFKAISKQEA